MEQIKTISEFSIKGVKCKSLRSSDNWGVVNYFEFFNGKRWIGKARDMKRLEKEINLFLSGEEWQD